MSRSGSYWTRKLELELIEFIKQRECVWKPVGNTNHDIQKKYKAYAEFAALLDREFTGKFNHLQLLVLFTSGHTAHARCLRNRLYLHWHSSDSAGSNNFIFLKTLLFISARTVRDRWVNIRSTFNHYLRKVEKSKAQDQSGVGYTPCWPLWRPLQFLREGTDKGIGGIMVRNLSCKSLWY